MTAISPATKHLTKEEVDQARLFLQQTQNSVLGSTRALTKTQWNFKPAPDKWSVAETLDHIVTVQERVLAMLASLSSAPAAPADRDTAAIDAIIIYRFPTRLTKFTAPQFIQPTGQILPAELLDRFKKNCVRSAAAQGRFERAVQRDGRISVDPGRRGAQRTACEANAGSDGVV